MKFLSLKTIIKPQVIAVSLGLLSLCFSYNTHAQKYHKWVDSNGSTHYTLTPPPHNAKRLGNVETYNDRSSHISSPISEGEQQSSETEQNNQTTQEKAVNETNERVQLPNQQNN